MRVYQADPSADYVHLRTLFTEYLTLVFSQYLAVYGVDIRDQLPTFIEKDMANLDIYLPPKGQMILIEDEGTVAGMGSLKTHGETFCEIKRMYVRPDFRGRGFGRAILNRLIEEGRKLDYNYVRLDSPKFFKTAHKLYYSIGFVDIEPYEQSEIEEEQHDGFVFMEMPLK